MRPRRACETAAARWQAKLRTTLTGFDPDLDRMWLAAIAPASMGESRRRSIEDVKAVPQH